MKSCIQVKENGHEPHITTKCPFFGEYRGIKSCKHPARLQMKTRFNCKYPEEEPPNRCPLREKTTNIAVSLINN